MKFLLLNQFYPPDLAPTGRFLHDLARSLVQAGHTVDVIASCRSYDGGAIYPADDTLDGVRVSRLRASGFGRTTTLGKLVDYASFCRLLAHRLRRRKTPGTPADPARDGEPDLVLSLTTPPYTGLLARWAAQRKGWRHAHWIMDVYPDAIDALARMKAGRPAGDPGRPGLAVRGLARLTRKELSGSALTLTLGPDMAARVSRYLVAKDPDSDPPLAWVPLWGEPGLSPWPAGTPVPMRQERGWAPDDLVLLYSGNMGLGHRFAEFLEAAKQTAAARPAPGHNARIRWAFAGEGKRRPEVESFAQLHPELGIQLLPYTPQERLREHLSSADVHLVSLDSRWTGCMVPSKLQSAFAVGRPVILVGGPDSALAQWIRGSGGGWHVPENDVGALVKAIEEASDPRERRLRGAKARAYSEHHFDATTNIRRIRDLLVRAAAAEA